MRAPLSRLWLGLLLGMAGCSGSSGSPGSPPPPLEPPPGTGLLEISMAGSWEIADLTPLEEGRFGPPGSPPLPGSAMQPPRLDDRIEIGDRRFLRGAGRPLRRVECERSGSVVRSYYNQVGRRFAVYDMECHSPVRPGVPDGGGSRLQMAFGSIGEDELLGRVRFVAYGAPVPAGTPRHGLYTVRLVRVP